MTTKKKIIIFGIAVGLSLILQMWLEERHYVDSLGLRYTMICALAYSAPITLLTFFVAKKIQ